MEISFIKKIPRKSRRTNRKGTEHVRVYAVDEWSGSVKLFNGRGCNGETWICCASQVISIKLRGWFRLRLHSILTHLRYYRSLLSSNYPVFMFFVRANRNRVSFSRFSLKWKFPEIGISALGSQICSNFVPHMSCVHCACSFFGFPYHDDDAICLFHVPNCQFTLLFPLNALN